MGGNLSKVLGEYFMLGVLQPLTGMTYRKTVRQQGDEVADAWS